MVNLGSGYVHEMEVSRDNPNYVYAVYYKGTPNECDIYRTTDGGVTWTVLTPVPGNKARLQISLNPLNKDEIWAGCAYGSNGAKVYKSTDGGVTWTNMTSSVLDGEYVRDLYYQPNSNGKVYLANSKGVFYYDATTSSWIDFSAGLPFWIKPTKMLPFYKESKLRIAMDSHGIFSTPLAETVFDPIAQPITESDSVFCASETVQFDCYSILNHTGASWEWTFTPTPVSVSSTTTRNPQVIFGNSGYYSVTLKVTDGNGKTSTKTINNMVYVAGDCRAVDKFAGNALNCLDNNDYGVTDDLNTTVSNYTVTAWIKPNGTQAAWSSVVMNSSSPSGLNFTSTSNMLGYHWNGGGYSWVSNLTAPSNEWSHVALVITPTSTTIYLNGKAATTSATNASTLINSLYIGSYQGWSGRNMTGQIDEVTIWKRALTQNEIRDTRHLTKENLMSDADLLAYYQFNQLVGGRILNKKGTTDMSLLGGVSLAASAAPVGSGVSSRKTISSNGTYSFGSTGVSLTWNNGTKPNGEVVVTRINGLPDTQPSGQIKLNEDVYFILNNYGSNTTFTDPNTAVFSNLGYLSSTSATYRMFLRGENASGSTWIQDVATSSKSINTNSTLNFGNNTSLSGSKQIALVYSDAVISTSAEFYLEGAYTGNGPASKMSTALSAGGASSILATFATTQPYSAAPWNYAGTETVSADFFANHNNIVDWVLIELRDKNNISNILYRRAGFLLADGNVMDINGNLGINIFAPHNDYYVSIVHRNHASVVSLTNVDGTAGTATWNIKTANSNVYTPGSQSPTKAMNSDFVLYGGDPDNNQTINASDNTVISIDFFKTGYYFGDTNLDGIVNASDNILISLNFFLTITLP